MPQSYGLYFLDLINEAMQSYNIKSEINAVSGYNLVKLNAKTLKTMSEIGLKADDWQYVELFEKYLSMRADGQKYTYIIATLAERHGISESSVKRIVNRFLRKAKL